MKQRTNMGWTDISEHLCSRGAARSSYGFQSTGMGGIKKSFSFYLGYILLAELLFLSSERDEVPGFGHTGSPKLLRGEVEEGQGETVGLGDQEGVTELDVNIRKKLN